ncbi:unnamed protein product [Rhizoctonia solani]|uniref:CBM1 domain-containing protein n=1 Tax=Rhizoctonia solani TaxID=456999 RepID=A0A8H3B0U3_9AGAM|nr:unnamed protein product [Rhizoctonia solani]
MRAFLLFCSILGFFTYASAQLKTRTWEQCGGSDWNYPLTCSPESVCVFVNKYFSQCVPRDQVPGSSTVTPGATSTLVPTGTVAPTIITSCAPSVARAALQPRSTGPPIVALDGWAAGSYLQKASGSDAAILGSASSRGWFLTAGSIRLIYWGSSSCAPYLFLNIKTAGTSYKPLAFEASGTTFDWSFSGSNGTLSTPSGFNTFVTCSGGALYLQTGTDLPSGNCTTTRLKISQ